MHCSNRGIQHRIAIIIMVSMYLSMQAAMTFADLNKSELVDYIGMPAEQIVNALGDPLLRTPLELWYRNEAEIGGRHPEAPNPAVALGRSGVVIRGTGGDYPPLGMSRHFCDIVVKLNRSGTITSIESHGPGCFEFIHVLKDRHAIPP
jgi:hypothetical protein